MGKIKLLLPLLLLALILSGCAKKEADITVDFGLQFANGSKTLDAALNRLNDRYAQWKSEHPEISIAERKRINNADFSHLAVLGAEHLPDVFITDCLTGRLLADAGLLKEVDAADVGTFTYDGGVYAFPVLPEYVSAVVYDPAAGSGPLGYSVENGQTLASDFLSAVLSDTDGQEWLDHLISGDKSASFTEGFFTERLNTLQTLSGDAEKYASADALVSAFVSGECTSALLNGVNLYCLLDTVEAKNPDLYARLALRPLVGASLPQGYQYGIFLKAGLDGEKLDACLNLCKTLAGITYQEDARLEELKETSLPTHIVSQLFSTHFWSLARTECISKLGEITAEECASAMQNCYEQYYLNIEDYSSKLNQFIK